jgi:hypothetical protein
MVTTVNNNVFLFVFDFFQVESLSPGCSRTYYVHRLASNSQSSCLCLLRAGIAGEHYHSSWVLIIFYVVQNC